MMILELDAITSSLASYNAESEFGHWKPESYFALTSEDQGEKSIPVHK
jgi:hypothetical protein